MALVTVAPIASRSGSGGPASDGVYKTNSRAVPAGFYTQIVFSLTFTNEATDFVTGDVLFGAVELSTDGGQSWKQLCEAEWHGGTDSGKGYAVAVNSLTVPANSSYRASARVFPAEGAGGAITFGVTADAILGT